MNELLRERARLIGERALVRAWEYRQRGYSKGVWFRFRRVLVDAAEAWIIDEADADALERRGLVPHAVGRDLAPPKRLFFLSREELELLPHRRQVPVRLHRDLLLARSLALLPFSSVEGDT